jgi:hypothetical protein
MSAEISHIGSWIFADLGVTDLHLVAAVWMCAMKPETPASSACIVLFFLALGSDAYTCLQ